MSLAKKSMGLIVLLLIISLLAPQMAPASAAFRPRFTTLKIGLSFGSSAVASANLMNADGFGRGFDFGHFDSNRNFVPIGAWTDEHRITMTMSRNMVWHPTADEGRGAFREGTSGNVVVGAFHVMLSHGFNTFEEARAAASMHAGGFVRYQRGRTDPFLVLIGQHISRDAANAAMASLGIPGAEVVTGTQNTIKVVRTGTNHILFEFDAGAVPLGVMPRSIAGESPETWFRGFRYHGGFTYQRRGGELLTVVNMVDIEDYVKGVVPYEMSPTWPMEALKAQAVTARTFAMWSVENQRGRHTAHGFDLCVEEHCQVYRGRGLANTRTDHSVSYTRGMFITHNGQLAETVYASSNGGASESSENVWVEARPYLRGVVDPFEADIAHLARGYNWTVTRTQADLSNRLRNNVPGFNLGTVANLRVSRWSPTGNVLGVVVTDVNGRTHTLSGWTQIIRGLGVNTLRFNLGNEPWQPGSIFANHPAQPVNQGTSVFGVDGNGNTVMVPSTNMRALGADGAVATVGGGEAGAGGGGSLTPVNGAFTIRGTGLGHQVGMSQWGAFSMAEFHNKTFRDIVHFYFTGVEITETFNAWW